MRKHYYIVNGLQPWSKADEKKLDRLVGEGFIGNVTEKLMQKGYQLNEEKMVLFAPDGAVVCRFCETL